MNKTDLALKELRAILRVLPDYETCSHHQMMAVISRLKFAISVLEEDTVRLEKSNG